MHYSSGARRSLRMLLATAVAAFIGLVPAVFVATPAYAAGEVDFTSDQESVENDAFVFELVRQGGSPDKLDLTYTTEDGTAEAGKDYTAISGTTSFPAGSTRATTKKFTVQGLADALDEDDETFTLKFTGTVGGQPIVREAQGILDDDDVTPTYTLAMTDTVTHAVIGSVNENVPAARITATLSAVSGRAVTIPLSTSDGTAVQPDDYTGQTNTPLSIPTGQTTGYVDVPINDDLFDEEDMETFSVAGSGETNTTAAPGPALQVQIADNDAMPTVNVLGPGAETEGTQIDFTVNLSAASKRVVTVVANTETGTASSADFTAVTNQSVVFSPGETIKTVSVPTTTDALDELTPEDFKVKLTAPGAPTQGYYTAGTMEATGHITDDDALPVVSMSPASVTEGNVGVRDETFTVSLGAASGREVRVGYAVQGDSATEDEDFEAVTPGELVFAAGQTTKTFTVKIKSDVKDEPNEDFKVILSNAAGTASLAPGAMHTVTINDDDALPQLSTFPDLTMAEGDTQETKNIQVALTNPSSSSITLDVTATPGSAVIMAGSPGANDFEAPSSTVTIPAGQTTANVTFQVNGDEVYEGPESATIKVATTLNDPAVAAGDLTSTLTLNNDDDAPLVELQAQTGRTESQTAAITATVTGVSQDPVAITLAAAGDAPPNGDPAEPGDFDATNLLAAVNLPAGVISNPWTVGTVDLIPDTADENAETVKVSLTGVPDVAPVWLTINDDAADKTPTIVAAGLQKNESDGTVQVPVTLSFSLNGNQALTTEKRITAGYTTEDGTAKQPGDYTTATGTVDFVAGDVSESIPVTINEDTVFERTELFKVKLATPSPGDAPIAPASVDVEIADNDSGQEPVLDDLVAPAAFAEGTAGTADFTVKLDRVAAEDVDVKVTVTDGSATHGVSGPGKDDFELPASPVTVHAGDTSLVVPITINNDDVFEHTETATVGIELAPGETDAVNAPQPVSATLTIVDDDPEPTVVLNTVDGAEGSTVPVTGTMTGVTQDPIAITVVAAGAVNAGSHQADPQDFTATFTATNLPGGAFSNPIALGSIVLENDTVDEYDQTVKVTLTGLTTTPTPAWVTIADAAGDKAPTVVPAGAQVNEDVGSAAVPVTLDFGQNGNQAQTTERKITASYTTADGTAKQPGDYLTATGTVEFNPGDTAKSIPVTIKTDGVYELSETFAVNLSSPSPGDAPIAPTSVTVRIDDVDSGAKPVLNQLAAPVTTVKEGVTATAGFTVQLDRPASEDVDVTVTVTDGSATHGVSGSGKDDFELPASPVTVHAGDTSLVVPITVKDDGVYELIETATVKVVVAAGELDAVDASSPVTATLSIVDDDPEPTVVLNTVDGAEGSTVPVTGTMTGVTQDPIAITVVAAGAVNAGSHQADPQDFTATFTATNLPGGAFSNPIALGSIVLENDTVDEYDQTVKVTLTGLTTTPTPAWVTIADAAGDKAPTVVPAGAQVNEDVGSAAVPVTLDFGQNGNQAQTTERKITASYTTADGTAKQPGDYLTATGTVEFNPGDTAKSIPVTIKTDGVYELSETFAVNLSSPSPGDAPIAPMSVTVRIDDVDSGAKPVLNQLAAPVTTVKEGVTTTAGFTIQLNRPASEDVDVKVTVTDGSATHGVSGAGKDDFEVPTSPVTVHAGDTSVVVPITVKNDGVFEQTETATVGIELAPGEADAVNAPQPVSATLTIVDDDPEPTVVLNTVNGAEGSTVPVTGTMTGVTQDPIAITLAAAGAVDSGSHQADPQDFTATFTATNLPGGAFSNPIALGSIVLENDTVDEYDQTVKVTLTGLTTTPTPAWVTIADAAGDKAPTVVPAGAQVNEDVGSAAVPVTLDFGQNGNQAQTTERKITASYATADGTAKQPGDYLTAAGTVEFNPGDTGKSIPVTIKTDGVYELSETFAVNLSSPSPGDAPIAPMSVTVRIDDVDSGAKPVLNQLAAPVTTVKEGVTTTAGFTIQLDRPASEDVDVTVTVTDGTATHQSNVPGKNDFEAPAVPVTILAGASSAVVPITINNDDVYELTETATVKVVVAAGELDAVDAPSPVTATLSIEDDDAAPVITALSGVSSAAEGNASVAVQGAMTGVAQDAYPITVTAVGAANLSGSDPAEPGDFTKTGLVTTLPAGLHGPVVPLGTISLLNDKADEWDETIRVSLTGAGTPAPSWLTITDDPDDLPPTVGIDSPAQPAGENAGPALVPVTLDFTDSEDADSTQKTVTVKYATANGTAHAPGDYTAAVTNASVSFPAGTTAKNISVPIINDLIFERTEDFTVTITEPGPTGVALGADVATVTIDDDDSTRKPTFSISDASFAEGSSGNANFTITLSSITTQPVAFDVSVNDGTATHGVNVPGPGQNDFTEPATTVTVPAGSATVSIPVPVANDSAYEGDEEATLTVSPVTGESDVAGQSDSGDLTITDNDARPTIELTGSSGSEGTDLQIRATVTGVAQRDLPFDVAFDADSSAEVNPAESEDYTDNEVSGVIPGGYYPVKPLTLGTVTLNQDEIDEPAEFFRIRATDTADADVSVSANYRINDDPNDLPPTVAIDDTTTIDEDVETVDVHVKLNFDSDATSTEQTLSVGWKTADGTARAGYDYLSRTGVLTFEPGVTDLSANVPIVNDTVDEPSQSFSVTLLNALPKGVGIDQDTGQVQINENDNEADPTLTAPPSRAGTGAIPITGKAREGAQVRIYAAAASTPTKWFLADTATANVYGIYVASVPFDMGYYLQARVGSATSEAVLVRVTQVPVLTATSTTAGVVNLTVAGNPKQAGLGVTIQRKNANGTWSNVITGTTAGTAKTFAYALKGQKSGTTITFRATIAANATWGTLLGTSVEKPVRVR